MPGDRCWAQVSLDLLEAFWRVEAEELAPFRAHLQSSVQRLKPGPVIGAGLGDLESCRLNLLQFLKLPSQEDVSVDLELLGCLGPDCQDVPGCGGRPDLECGSDLANRLLVCSELCNLRSAEEQSVMCC